MSAWQILDPFAPIGTVTLTRRSLYLDYSAELTAPQVEILRLYCHTQAGSVRLGVFAAEDGCFRCGGSVSLRTLGASADDLHFSVCETPWRPVPSPMADGVRLCDGTLARQDGDGLEFAIGGEAFSRENAPFFCLMRRGEINGKPCFFLRVDGSGIPRL